MRIIIHPGYSKTATTYFQQSVFPKLEWICYMGKNIHGMENDDLTEIFLKDFFGNSSSNYSKKAKVFSKLIANYMQNSEKNTFLISIEEIQDRDTNVVNKTKKYNTNTDYNLYRINLLISELVKIIGPIKVDFLITIREQKDFLSSNYAGSYNVFKKCMYKFYQVDTFEKFIKRGLSRPYDDWIGSLFYYDEIMKYESLGMGQVKIMLYEDFKENPEHYLQDLFNFLGSRNNKSLINSLAKDRINSSSDNKGNYYSELPYIYKLLMFLRRGVFGPSSSLFLKKIHLQLKKILSSKVRVEFSEDHSSKLDAMYAENNQLLDNCYNLNLSKKGYCCKKK